MFAETMLYLLIAMVSSALLIILSKIILQKLLRRPADYYDAEERRQEKLMLKETEVDVDDELATDYGGTILPDERAEDMMKN